METLYKLGMHISIKMYFTDEFLREVFLSIFIYNADNIINNADSTFGNHEY